MTFITQAQLTATPYPGLRPFKPTEVDIFFGREEQTDQLLKKLQTSRFLAVVGPSGCGKSSLVRAGMIPALEAGFLVGAGPRWRVARMRPGQRPLARLAEALASQRALGPERGDDREAEAFLRATLGRGPLGLVEALRETPPPERFNLLLLVDQFEEIFRFRKEGDPEEADAFVSLLLETARQEEFPVYVVLTMRSDYLGDCAIFSGLPEALNDSQFLTPRLSREQSEAAIVKPARVFGGRLEPALVNRLLNDMGADPDQLPLLQHCLMRMWTSAAERAAGDGGPRTITSDDYSKVGGLERALSIHANDILENLTPEQQRVAEVMFRRLTERAAERGETRRDTRRPARLGDIAGAAGVSAETVAEVVEEFRKPDRSFLMPPQGTPLNAETLIDISHESLIKLWDTLDGWATEEARSAAFYERLKQAALNWQDDAGLLGGKNLERAVEWEELQSPTPEWAARYGSKEEYAKVKSFLNASKKNWEKTQLAEASRLETERRAEIQRLSARRYRLLSAGLALVCVLAVGLVVFALQQRAVAEAKSSEAEKQTLLAKKSAHEAGHNLEEANKQKAEAERQKELASQSEAAAQGEKRKAEGAAKDAREQKELAVASAHDAAKQRDLAKANEAEATRLKQLAEKNAGELSLKAKELAVQAVVLQAQRDLADLKAEEARQAKLKADAATEEARNQKALADKERDDARKAESEARIAAEEADKQRKSAEEKALQLQEANDQLAAYKSAAGAGSTTTNGGQNGRLKLNLTDIYGNVVEETVTVSLHNQTRGDTKKVEVDFSKGDVVNGLYTLQKGIYNIVVDAPSYLPVTRFVNIKPNGDTEVSLKLPFDPEKVTNVQFPIYGELPKEMRLLLSNSDNVFGFEGKHGEALYNALDDLRKASLLNLTTKARATACSGGRSVLSYIVEIRELRGDRFIAVVDRGLREETKNGLLTDTFRQVAGTLNYSLIRFTGFTTVGSFRTADEFGSLQLTFFAKDDALIADVDIDESSGVSHTFQVLKSYFSGKPTHPYNIHEILYTNQNLDSGLRLLPSPKR
jgi:hypothetical protein